MRPRLSQILKIVRASLLGFLALAGIAAWWQWEALKKGYEDWRQKEGLEEAMQRHVSHLGPVDEIEIILLSPDPASPRQKPFHKSVERGVLTYEAKKVTLKGAEALALAALWRSQTVDRNGVNCHEPHHALRFLYHGGEVSRAIICFHCENAEIPVSFFGGDLIGFDSQTTAFRELKAQILQRVGGGEVAGLSAPR